MIDFYREIVPQLDVTVVYNGDTDPCVSWEGTAVAIERVGFEQVDGGSYRPWFYNHTAVDLGVLEEKAALFEPDLGMVATGPQFGGEVVNYEHNLMFVKGHGSGHMVPHFRPQVSLFVEEGKSVPNILVYYRVYPIVTIHGENIVRIRFKYNILNPSSSLSFLIFLFDHLSSFNIRRLRFIC